MEVHDDVPTLQEALRGALEDPLDGTLRDPGQGSELNAQDVSLPVHLGTRSVPSEQNPYS